MNTEINTHINRSPRVAVILPAYNEELTIRETIFSFSTELPDAEIYVINNNSSDQTYNIAQKTISDLKCKGSVLNEPAQGKGNALRQAFMAIDSDIYVLADADMTYPAEEVHKLIQPIIDMNADMVVGDRISEGHYQKENRRKFHDFGNMLVIWLVNTLFKANLKDIMSGYRAFNKKFIKNYPILVDGFQVETDVTLHALDKRYKIKEIPIAYKDRPEGSHSKLNTVFDGAKVVFTIAQILRYYRPLFFFGVASFAFFVIGLLVSIPVFSDWYLYQYIYHVPLALLAVGLELVAVAFISTGLILDAVKHQQNFNYESSLLKFSRNQDDS